MLITTQTHQPSFLCTHVLYVADAWNEIRVRSISIYITVRIMERLLATTRVLVRRFTPLLARARVVVPILRPLRLVFLVRSEETKKKKRQTNSSLLE